MGLLKKPNAAPNVDAMRETADALGITLTNDESPKAMIADLRAAFDERLKEIPEDDHIVCAKCGERTDDDARIERCPFCGDEGTDDETASALESGEEGDEDEGEAEEGGEEPIEGEEIDPGEDAEEPAPVDLDAPEPAAAAPAAEPEKPAKKGRTKKAAAEPAPAAEAAPAPAPAAEAPVKKGRKKAAAAEAPAADPAPAAEAPAKKGRKKAAESADLAPLENVQVTELKKALDAEDKKIEAAQRDIVTGSWDLGIALRTVHEKELWKAAGHKTFTQYLTAKGIGRTFAYDLMELTQKFDRKTFEDVGRKKLMLVARAGGPEAPKGAEILDKAKAGASVSQLESEVKGKPAAETEGSGSPRKAHEVKAHERGGDKEPPAKDGRITLLAKVGSKPETVPFLDRKTRQPVKVWAPETFAEVKIAADVSMFVALKTDKEGKPIGLTVAYKRAEAEAAE